MSAAAEESVEPSDLETIMPDVAALKIDGIECRVRRLKTREVLSFLAVLTRGVGPQLAEVQLDFSSPEAIATDVSALLLLAVPNAPDEFAVFLRRVVEPVNEDDASHVASYLIDNPEPGDVIDIIEAIATQEKDDLAVLAGKAQSMWQRLATLYAPKKQTPKKTSRGSGGRSPARST